MNLSNICYEQIKENFWYGILGDFKLVIDRDTEYFNATKLCEIAGKRFRNWLRNSSTKQLIDYLTADARIRAPGFYEKFGDNNDDTMQKITGTYVPKELILNLASWISPQFYIKCNDIIIAYYIVDYEDHLNDKHQLKEKLTEIENSLDKLKLENQNLENQNLKLTAAPYTENIINHNCLVILKKNEPNQNYPYYAIRTQRKNLKRALNKAQLKYPNLEIIYKKSRDPNSIKLYNLIVQELDIDSCGNHFFSYITEKELISETDRIYEWYLPEKV